MQDIEKNMDDLFRKAVDNYQLKPGESNWEKIVPQLLSGTAPPPATPQKNSIKKYSFILLLLFLILISGGVLIKYIVHKDPITVVHKSKNKINDVGKKSGSSDKEANTIYKSKSKEKRSTGKENYLMMQHFSQTNNNWQSVKKDKFSNTGITVINENTQPEVVLSPVNGDINKNASLLINQINSAQTVQNKSVTEEKTGSDSLIKVVSKLNPVQNQRGIYFGASIGASFNSIKYQEFGRPGFDIGIITGYQLTSKASVETGLFFGKKYYFTDGKYFSMDKVSSSMPPEMKILSLKGSSTLFEIPLNLKYKIVHKNKTAISS